MFNELTVQSYVMFHTSRDTGACRQTSCLKTSGQTVLWRRHATAALAAEPRVARWRRHAFPGCIDGAPRPTQVTARHAGWHDGQCTPRTAAGPRVQSELIAATLIHYKNIHLRIRE